jgi:NAD(P)-dependent dehydrogenase (short-subunit alcohol dehydrogenase family)
MSKASLNMITKTIACDLLKQSIIVCSIDVGWVSNMKPGDQLGTASKAILDYSDAVSRIMHPFSQSTPIVFSGQLIRHYQIQKIW